MSSLIHMALQIFQRGGIVMAPLLGCSILSLYLILERSWTLQKRKIIKSDLIEQINELTTKEDISIFLRHCREVPNPLANCLATGLQALPFGREESKESIEDQARQESRVLKKGLGALETIAGISPLLGLLGTVTGIIHVFAKISTNGIGDPAQMADGIYEALFTTATGLIIAIPTLIAYNIFLHRVSSIILDIEKYANRMLRKVGRILSIHK